MDPASSFRAFSRRRLANLLLLISAFSACSDSPTGSPTPAVLSITLDADVGPLLMALRVELDASAAIEVDYWTATSSRLRVTSPLSTSHHIVLTRLVPTTIYDYEIRLVGQSNERDEAHLGTFKTDSLPTGLAQILFNATGEPSLPLTMLEFIGTAFQGFAMVDENGRVVWYWPTVGIPTGSTRRENGNFVLLDRGIGLREISPDRSVIAEFLSVPGREIHHDVIATPQNTLLFIANQQGMINDTLWVGEAIWEWHPEQGKAELNWNAFDFLSPVEHRGLRSRPGDWLHANSLSFGPRQNLLVSFAFLDQIISISADYQSLEWALGGPGSTFELAPDAVFSGQHTALEVSPGRVLLFDNGFDRLDGGEYSRALEVELDVRAQTARNAWQFRPQPDQYSRIISSARRLLGGNTMVTFGIAHELPSGSSGPEVYEVTPRGTIAWHLQVDTQGTTAIYRATPFANVGGEISVLNQ